MKIEVEVHETAKRKPTEKDAASGLIGAYDRSFRCWTSAIWEYAESNPSRFPLWFSLNGFPKPAPLRARKK